MAGSANSTVTASGKAAVRSSQMDRRGPGGSNVQSTRRNRPNPVGMLRSMKNPKGPDKGSGGGA